jgi:ParB family chromosome partitioning protein
MASKPVFEPVSLDRIDTQDYRYKITTGGPSGPLVASVKRVGILTPPVLIPKKDDSLIIISGFRRIAALKRLGENETTAWVLDREISPERCIEIAISDNAAQRKLNPVEQGRAVLLMETLYPNADELCQLAGDLGIPLNPRVARKLRMAAQMNACLRKALVNGDVALPVALQLAEMEDQSAAEGIAVMIGAMGLGLNRQRELLDWLKAISRREEIALSTLLEDQEIHRVLENADLDRKQRGNLLRRYFRQRRYPEIVDMETRFHETVKTLQLGKGIRLEPPPFFEDKSYSLKIEFSDASELLARYQRLGKVMDSPAMVALWDLLRSL